jgi:serine/threonine protein kinase
MKEYLARQEGRCLKEDEARKFLNQMISALDFLNKNQIVHPNLNLDNVFVIDKELKMTDFLISSKISLIYHSVSKMNPYYFYPAPELWLEYKPTPASQVWTLGTYLFVMLTGRFPFTGIHEFEIYRQMKNIDQYVFPPTFPGNILIYMWIMFI